MKTHLFLYPGHGAPTLPANVAASKLPRTLARAADAIDLVLRDDSVDLLAFWDLALGPVPWNMIVRFGGSLDDAWHPGAKLTGTGNPDLLRHVQPLWVYRPDPLPDLVGAINWKLDLRATFVRASVMRQLGGIDQRFDTIAGAAQELGLRFLRRGAVCRQQPDIIEKPIVDHDGPSLADRYRLLRLHHSNKWAIYSLVRRLMQRNLLVPELIAWRRSRSKQATTPASVGAVQRNLNAVRLSEHTTVSVVLPTFGRYRYVAEVLEDLRAQTIRPTQILVADGNPPAERQPQVYERYADLPIEVLWHAETGICSGRNACLERVTGDFVWFVDDDSRFDARNLEAHLRALVAYGADVSVGPAYTRSRPELHGDQRETTCTFMDCGTTLVRRSLLETVGGFDMAFNQYLVGEDGELGIRFVRAGGLMLNNPVAKRFHYVAPVGGSRSSKRSVHRFTRWSLLPRPVQSIYYTARRYYEPGVVADAMFQACLLDGWRRREGVTATRRWRLKTLFGELFAVPVTALRLHRSVQMGRKMVAEGPSIAPLTRAHADEPLQRVTPR